LCGAVSVTVKGDVPSAAIMPEFMFSGTICHMTTCDLGNIPGVMLCKGSNEFLCLESKACLAAGDQYPIGLIKEDGFICKLGLPCCTYGLKIPDKLCLGKGECLCMKSAQACPFVSPITKPVCAICAFQLMPQMGFMKPPPESIKVDGGAPPEGEAMER